MEKNGEEWKGMRKNGVAERMERMKKCVAEQWKCVGGVDVERGAWSGL